MISAASFASSTAFLSLAAASCSAGADDRGAGDRRSASSFDASGKMVWRGEGLRQGSHHAFTLTVPRELLPDGAYRYRGGWNLKAVAATLLGCALAWGGLVIPALKPLYDYAWFVGFGVAFAVYVVLTGRRR